MRKNKMTKKETDPIAGILVIILVGLTLLWIYVIKPVIDWITQLINSITNWLSSNSTEIIYGITIAGILGVVFYIRLDRAKKHFEEEQRVKGLVKFIDRFKKEKWGTSQEIEIWKNQEYEEEQKLKGLVKFTNKNGDTIWNSPQQIEKYLERLDKEQFEEDQKAKGIVKFIDRLGNEKWGTQKEMEKWKKEDKEAEIKESLFYRVVESIEKFKPSRNYGNEFGYHTELQGWLKAHFPSAAVEIQTGASRPDIVIDNVAIEIKGPTDNRALDTLTTKCLKYTHYYPHLAIVLFEPCFSETNYKEIAEGIKRFSTNIKIIRKEKSRK